MRDRLLATLNIRPLDLSNAWWHSDDIETTIDELRLSLACHDLADALPEARLRADHRRALDENRDDDDLLREHQLAVTAVAANERLAERGDTRRFRCFDRALALERDDPAWLLVTPDEHARLRAASGALDPRDALYDAVQALADVPAIDWTRSPVAIEKVAPWEARRRATAALAQQRYNDALALYPIAVRDGDHGLLAELEWIETLRRAGDRAGSIERWRLTADTWLSGTRGVWDTQWTRLLQLYTVLQLDDADRRTQIEAKLPRPAPPPAPTVEKELGTGAFDQAIELGVGAMWLVNTNVHVARGNRMIIGDTELEILEHPTLSTGNEAAQVGIRILEDRPAPARGTLVRFFGRR